jgi:hypothetical protein
MPFGPKIAETQHFPDQEWEVAKSGRRRKAIRFGVGLAMISGKHTEDLSRLAPMAIRRPQAHGR